MIIKTEENKVIDSVREIFSNWTKMEPDNNDGLYLADDRTVLYDVSPMQDLGWSAQKSRLKALFSGFEEFWINPNQDMSAHIGTDMAWVTATWQAYFKLKTGQEKHLAGRSTFVLQKKDNSWLVVHDHVSVPVQAE